GATRVVQRKLRRVRVIGSCGVRTWCRRGESNPRPRDYETLALPLSYAGTRAGFDAKVRSAKCQGIALRNTSLESLLMRQGIYYDGGAAMPRVPRSKQLMAE